jgi:hypothetical protein
MTSKEAKWVLVVMAAIVAVVWLLGPRPQPDLRLVP